jgi:hypothetical protein
MVGKFGLISILFSSGYFRKAPTKSPICPESPEIPVQVHLQFCLSVPIPILSLSVSPDSPLTNRPFTRCCRQGV